MLIVPAYIYFISCISCILCINLHIYSIHSLYVYNLSHRESTTCSSYICPKKISYPWHFALFLCFPLPAKPQEACEGILAYMITMMLQVRVWGREKIIQNELWIHTSISNAAWKNRCQLAIILLVLRQFWPTQDTQKRNSWRLPWWVWSHSGYIYRW